MNCETCAIKGKFVILSERIERLLDDYKDLKATVANQSDMIRQVLIIQKDISIFYDKIEKIDKNLKDNDDQLDDHESKLTSHSTIWKLVGGAIISCVGLIGWFYSTIRSLDIADRKNEDRIAKMEYKQETFEKRCSK